MTHSAEVQWKKNHDDKFVDRKFSRLHQWIFDGGIVLPASSSPAIVPIPMSDPSAVDPEEAFIAAISSCHMLFFLSIAATKKYDVLSYTDQAIGVMGMDKNQKTVMTEILLSPKVIFTAENRPTTIEIAKMHEAAHKNCFLANSIHTKISIIHKN